jgi:hypothetical protein
LAKNPFSLRDPKRANSGADISVTDDDFRRREEESWCEDNATHESYREIEFFHQSSPLRLAEIKEAVNDSFTTLRAVEKVNEGMLEARGEKAVQPVGDSPNALDCHSRDVFDFEAAIDTHNLQQKI